MIIFKIWIENEFLQGNPWQIWIDAEHINHLIQSIELVPNYRVFLFMMSSGITLTNVPEGEHRDSQYDFEST